MCWYVHRVHRRGVPAAAGDRPAVSSDGAAAWGRSTAAVARSFKVSWSTAWRAIAAAARHKIAALPTCPPRRLGIDETTFGRHRSFMTGLVDLDTSRLWDLIEGRSKKALVARLEALGEQVGEIEAVVIDPYAGYKAAVRDLAPQATRVADRFHIQRLAAQALTEVRCRRQQELTGHRCRKGDPLWAVRRDLLHPRHHLTTAAWERLDTAFRADCWDEVECAWTLKEMLSDLYTNTDRPAAEAALADWHHHAGAFDVAETNRLARTLRTWEPELLAYFDRRLTNGPMRVRLAGGRHRWGWLKRPMPRRVVVACSVSASR